ncbi:hypothetical protein, partial [Mucilaginibacter sp.]
GGAPLYKLLRSSAEIFSFLIKYSVPLIAAGATTFGLIQNVAKDQDGKNLLRSGPTPGPVFRRAFARFFSSI